MRDGGQMERTLEVVERGEKIRDGLPQSKFTIGGDYHVIMVGQNNPWCLNGIGR